MLFNRNKCNLMQKGLQWIYISNMALLTTMVTPNPSKAYVPDNIHHSIEFYITFLRQVSNYRRPGPNSPGGHKVPVPGPPTNCAKKRYVAVHCSYSLVHTCIIRSPYQVPQFIS